MKKKLPLIVLGILIISINLSCNKDEPLNLVSDQPYLPMQIGNYWKYDASNYTEIVDTIRIQGHLYYEFYTLTGGDSELTDYLRMDKDGNLIASSPQYPDLQILLAKFNAASGDTFWTRNDQTINDKKATVIEKDNMTMSFEYQNFYGLTETPPYTVSFKKGFGWTKNWNMWFDKWNEVMINGQLVPID